MSLYTPTAATIADLTAKHCALYTPAGVRVTTSAQIPAGTLSLRCDDGYRFVESPLPRMQWRYSNVQTQTGPFVNINAERTYGEFVIFTATQYVYNNVIVATEAIPVVNPGDYVVTAADIAQNTSKHVRLYKGEEVATANMVFTSTDTFRLVAIDDYKITDASFRDSNNGEFLPFEIAGDGLTATFINSGAADIGAYSVTTEELYPGSYRLTQSDITVAANGRAKFYKDGVLAAVGELYKTTDTFTLIPNEGYVFTTTGAYFRNSANNAVLLFTFNQNRSEANFTNSNGYALSGLSVTTQLAPQANHTITQADLDLFTAAKASLTLNGVAAAVDMQVFPTDVLVATAKAGRVFYQPANTPDGFVSVGWRSLESGGFSWFDRVDDTFKTGRWVVGSDNWAFSTVDTVAEQPEDVRGFNNIYEISEDQLKLVTQSRWVSPPDGGEQIDYGKYILGLIDLPFKIDPEMVVTTQDVRLGPLNTNIAANFLNSDTLRLSLGEIAVVGTKGNFLDFKNTIAVLHLPYCDSVTLDIEMVIGQTIIIEYLISLYDGTATINVTSSKTDDIILTQNIDMNILIPFANINTYPSKNAADSVRLGGDNGVKTAFIELLRNNSVLENGFFTSPIVDESALSEASGFITVEEINLKNSTATKREKDTIINLLQSGVIV